MTEMRFAHAINRALDDAMAADRTALLLGEDIGKAGGSFALTRGLQAKYGADRVIDTPISENALGGMAVWLALSGFRPVIEIMFMDFMALTMDALVNQAAKAYFMFGGQSCVPLVVRTQHGGGLNAGPQHSQCLEAWSAHIPGLKPVCPSSLEDAYGLLRQSIDDPNPVIFVEHKSLYSIRGDLPPDCQSVALGSATLVRSGTDVTIVSNGGMMREAVRAADLLDADGVSAELIDLRSIPPCDEAAILSSLARTHHLVVVHESVEAFGVGAEIVARMADIGFDELDGPIIRVGAPFMPVPFSRELEAAYIPAAAQIVQAAHRALL
jgi:pyruvate dehydrogenase E1 component beta subunit